MRSVTAMDETFTIDTARLDGSAHFALHGELDLAAGPALERALAATDGGPVVLDLSGLWFADLTGVRLLLAAQERLGARLTLRTPPCVTRVRKLAGL